MFSLNNLYDYARLFFVFWAIVGFGVSAGAALSAHLDALANSRSKTDGGATLYALTRRSGELLTFVAQSMLLIVGFVFISAPPPPLVGPAGEAGVFRVTLVAIAVMALTIKSAIVFVNGATIQRLMKDAARVPELETVNRLLEATTRAKSDFLASMSHELRTPLNAILGFSDLLAEQVGEALSERHRRYLHNIHDGGAHLLELINDVLDLSKVEAGRIVLRPETVQLGVLLEPVAASTQRAADTAGLLFSVGVPTDEFVRLDPARNRQILYNLLSNAVKFTPRGGAVALAVETRARDLVIAVRDTGIGIPADRQDRVFGAFERLNEDRSKAGGTGLGLALTKRLAELQGGTIEFDSSEGHGTTFRVVLPEAVVEPISGPRVLVVEDEPGDAELMVELARASGMPCEVVPTAEGALAAIARDRPAAVVLDLRLPDRRGERVLEALKRDEATRSVPVIVVTVEDDDGRTRQLGADEFLTKPIDRARLAAWLERVGKEKLLAAAAR